MCHRKSKMSTQGDRSPGKVREFQSGQGKVRGSEIRCFQALNTPKLAYDAPLDP